MNAVEDFWDSYYFSTHGCVLPFVCFSGLASVVPLAAAALRAFRSKKELAMMGKDQFEIEVFSRQSRPW
jgi:hypothetical protein